MRGNIRSLFGIAVFILMFSVVSKADIFTAYLTGAQEVPPVATNATGYARIFVDAATGNTTYYVVFNNLSSNQTASHIHAPAPVGANIGVAVNFGAVGGTSGIITGQTNITQTQLAQLRAHLGYVNVHSANFVGGEIRGQLALQRPVDYDGDGRTDLSVLRFPNIAPPGVSPITWWNQTTSSGVQILDWGNANTDFPAPGDYDGDAVADFAVFRQGAATGDPNDYWIVQSADLTMRRITLGVRGDQTVQRDYDGDGETDAAVFRRGATATSNTLWLILESSTGNIRGVNFGLTGNGTTSLDAAVPGDYDGDGKFDIAVYRFGQSPSNHYIILNSSDGSVRWQQFGNFNSDWVVPGDYDGDGKYDLAVARTGTSGTSPLVWWIWQSSTSSARVQTFGLSSDFPTQGDYDGDGRTDIAIWRRGSTATAQSVYWIWRSFDQTAQVSPWGIGQDFSVNTFDTR